MLTYRYIVVTITSLLLSLCMINHVSAGPDTANDFVDRGKTGSKAVTDMLLYTIKNMPTLKNSGKLNQKQLNAMSRYLREEIANVKYGRSVPAPKLYPPYNIGDIGLLNKVEILQVIDKNNVIVIYKHLTFADKQTLFWLKINTKEVANGDNVEIVNLVKITNTVTYNTLVGTNTVYQLHQITNKELANMELKYKLKNGKIKKYKIITIGSILGNILKITK